MGVKRDFDIDLLSLKEGRHEYEFGFNDSFFDLFEEPLVSKGEGKVKLTLNKALNLLELTFEINGSVRLVCDRSLDPFDMPIELSRDIIMKYGEEDQELSEDIMMINWDTQRINVAQLIYEFISLEVPIRKLHPRYENEESSIEDDELFYQSEKPSDENKEKIDPRWEALKELKNKR